MPAQKKHDEEAQARAGRMYGNGIAEGEVSWVVARKKVGELLGIKQEMLWD